MDLELRSFLEAMELRTNARMEAIRTDMAAMEQRTNAKMETMEQRLTEKIDETRALHEETWKKIDALGEGLSTHQREETCRIVADRERALMDQHILPLGASAANHEKRLKAAERRVGL